MTVVGVLRSCQVQVTLSALLILSVLVGVCQARRYRPATRIVPPPAADPQSKVKQYILFDGASGVTRDFWNRGLGLHWRNSGGDWRDRNGAAQGSVPFATGALRDGQVTLDLTELVERWLATGNTGLLIRTTSPSCTIASREDPDPSRRPSLVVVTEGGSAACPCTADASMSSSTAYPLGRKPVLSMGTFVMQFDLSAVTGPLRQATLTLHAVASEGPVQFEVMQLDPPHIFTGGGTPRPGLARDYTHDRGIQAHPDVLVAADFSGDGWKRLFGERISDPTFGRDPTLKATYIRGQFVKGSVGSASLNYMWTEHKQPEPEEVYFRYYVLLENDFGSLVQGNKMPGLAGRYGTWNGQRYRRVTGNGGVRTVGDIGVDDQGRRLARGWSMRGVAYKKPSDDNPYRDLTGLITYAYHVDQRSRYGDNWRWSTACLERNRWYCIEQYAKMNTVEGPFDKYENGTGKRNGIVRAWVDGVLVFEKTDIRFRLNGGIKINEVWLNWYHGGRKPAAATHHWRMSNVVVARSYIGPMSKVVQRQRQRPGAEGE